MRKIPFVAALIALGTSGSAQAGISVEGCLDYARIAGQVMENRQLGVSRQAMLDDIIVGEENIVLALEAVVNVAYREPRYHTPTSQQRAAAEYQQRAFSSCLYVLGDQ